ncbi:MAG: mechanosensitive ion channel domain-containing protein [Ilumatobacteraceae bacterium]
MYRPPPSLPASSRPSWIEYLDRLHLLTPLRVLAVVFVALVATIAVRRVVTRALSSVFERAAPGDRTRAAARHKALSSALRAALVGVIWAVAVITMISEVGINIGGFVATATVVGGAIAFGAQTLIRDIISGFFVLADDQFGVGDEVDLGHASGTVERVTLRTAKLCDGEGRIWHVPHGNVLRVGNLSKSSVAALDVEISRSVPVDVATEVLHQLGLRLVADEVIATHLADTPVVLGVIDVRDDRYVIRIRVTTTPSSRELVKRAWRRLALQAFAAGELVAPMPPSLLPSLLPPT